MTAGSHTGDLLQPILPAADALADGVLLLHGFAETAALLPAIERVAAAAPFRHMLTPGGRAMSVAMTNCGALGWVSDRHGYRYAAEDPLTGVAWPAMPEAVRALAQTAAAAAGFAGFVPDACLINRYAAGSRLTPHQDRNERDFGQPIVSVSLGLPATFLLLGVLRRGRPRRIPLIDGDVLVWGGPARLWFHGIAELAPGEHPLTGPYRYNLTLRRAG